MAEILLPALQICGGKNVLYTLPLQAEFAGSRGPMQNWRKGLSAQCRRLMPLWFVGWLAMGGALLGVPMATAQTTQLMNTPCPTNLGSCTANEVQTTVVNVTPLASD